MESMNHTIRKLSTWPSTKIMFAFVIFGEIVTVLAFLSTSFFTSQTGLNTLQIYLSQLSFNDAVLKSNYQFVINNGGFEAYRIIHILDYFFILGYGIYNFGLAILVARGFTDKPRLEMA